jgi:nucleoside 2-deoxyribosyltransferase
MKIYLAGSISGRGGEEVITYFTQTSNFLRDAGYEVIHPVIAKGYLRNEIKFKAEGYKHKPMSKNHAILERDCWMVEQCDILYCNLTMAEIVSIGSCMELAWGHILRKHTVVAMQPDNIHRHAFVLEAGDVIFDTHPEAINYLLELLN